MKLKSLFISIVSTYYKLTLNIYGFAPATFSMTF